MTINAQNVKKRKRNFSMGRVKDMCMENEEKFYDLVGDLVRECDSVKECKKKLILILSIIYQKKM